jgi:hypothetical protein
MMSIMMVTLAMIFVIHMYDLPLDKQILMTKPTDLKVVG